MDIYGKYIIKNKKYDFDIRFFSEEENKKFNTFKTYENIRKIKLIKNNKIKENNIKFYDKYSINLNCALKDNKIFIYYLIIYFFINKYFIFLFNTIKVLK